VTRSPLVEAAAGYLNGGLAVIALTGKTPNVKVHRTGLSNPIVGPVETEADWELLVQVFEHSQTTGIGILTRWPYVVVDIDGEEGAAQWLDMAPEAFPPVDTWVAKTGRGLHIWYLSGAETGTIKLGPKLDLKGDGGYVAAPPSLHPDGHTYEWVSPPGEFLPRPAPEGLRQAIEDHLFDVALKAEGKRIRQIAWGPKYAEGDTVFYAQASHEPLIEGMAAAVEGNRNAYLHWAAATLAEEGGSDDEFELLGEVALKNGLEPVEVKRTIRSARKAHG
jgi:hypothetical protein